MAKDQIIDTDGQVLSKVTYEYGTVEYRNDKGQIHRIGGPAVICTDGTQEYYREGKIHRTDGPALIVPDGTVEYWMAGIEYTKEDYPKAVSEYKLKQLVG
jgi:hypothetical protein